MEPIWKSKRPVNQYIEKLAISPIKRFYPTSVAKFAKVPLEHAFKYLLEAAKTGELKIIWELRCPNYECGKSIDIDESNSSLNEITCPKCGNLIDVQSKYLFPAFEFDPEFRKQIRDEYLEKKNKLVTSPILFKNLEIQLV